MENQFKNEMEIELAGQKILLRPTFENLAKMETDMGGLPYLAWKHGQGIDPATMKVDMEKAAKSMISISDAAKVIFYNQAEQKLTLDQVFDLVMEEGVRVSQQVIIFIAKCASGNKNLKDMSAKQKKS